MHHDEDGLGHGDETELEGLLRLRQGLGERVLEDLIDVPGHPRRITGALDPDDEDPGAIGARLCGLLQGLVEIIPVEEEIGLIGLGVPAPVDPAQDEAPLARIDRPA